MKPGFVLTNRFQIDGFKVEVVGYELYLLFGELDFYEFAQNICFYFSFKKKYDLHSIYFSSIFSQLTQVEKKTPIIQSTAVLRVPNRLLRQSSSSSHPMPSGRYNHHKANKISPIPDRNSRRACEIMSSLPSRATPKRWGYSHQL